MATTLACPSCSRPLRVPDELLDKAVRCPHCLTTFTGSPQPEAAPAPVPAVPSSPVVVPNLALDDPGPSVPGGQGVVADERPAARPPAPAEDPADASTRPCPTCGERIGRNDKRCRYCGEDVAEEEERPWDHSYRRPVRRDCDPHRGQLILIFGIVSLVSMLCAFLLVFGLPLGIVAWVLGSKDLAKMDAGTMDPEGRGLTQAGRICGIVGTILDSLYLLGCGAYVVFVIVLTAFDH
jgi:hypothetical protein